MTVNVSRDNPEAGSIQGPVMRILGEESLLAEQPVERARRYKPEETRERILDAARTLFRTRGYVNTSTADIAAHAGVAEGSIFYHYGSKRNLLAALGREWAQSLIAAMRGDARDMAELTPAITIPRVFEFCATYGKPTDLIGVEEDDPEGQPFSTAAREVSVKFVEDMLRATVGCKTDCHVNIPLAASFIHAAVHDALMRCFGPEPDAQPEDVMAELIRFVECSCGWHGRVAA